MLRELSNSYLKGIVRTKYPVWNKEEGSQRPSRKPVRRDFEHAYGEGASVGIHNLLTLTWEPQDHQKPLPKSRLVYVISDEHPFHSKIEFLPLTSFVLS